ncbi:MAG: acyltransferase, partial [Sinobacteraceae bacterium]|nr:acyltransferase [Nevskiaceae bacterium]
MKHTKALDGIRAVAILLVMLFHFGYLPVGWVGVQIFFTLSGYLITGILLAERERPFDTYIKTFLWHRALRILPLLLFFLLANACIYLATGHPDSFPNDWPWLAGFAANLARMRTTDLGYCFVHIWSLAVEQQFYLIWPLLVYALSLRSLRQLVLGILLAEPLARAAMFSLALYAGHDPQFAGKAVYVLPFTQFDAFAAGAAIPVFGLQHLGHPGRKLILAIVAAAVLGAAVLAQAYYSGTGAFIWSLGYAMFLVQSHGYVWAYSLLNVISLLALICALRGMRAARFLELPVLAFVGRISFGMYVYHVPLLAFAGWLLQHCCQS